MVRIVILLIQPSDPAPETQTCNPQALRSITIFLLKNISDDVEQYINKIITACSLIRHEFERKKKLSLKYTLAVQL